jgi:hypothetical protein
MVKFFFDGIYFIAFCARAASKELEQGNNYQA